jgi:hypothetical protein
MRHADANSDIHTNGNRYIYLDAHRNRNSVGNSNCKPNCHCYSHAEALYYTPPYRDAQTPPDAGTALIASIDERQTRYWLANPGL